MTMRRPHIEPRTAAAHRASECARRLYPSGLGDVCVCVCVCVLQVCALVWVRGRCARERERERERARERAREREGERERERGRQIPRELSAVRFILTSAKFPLMVSMDDGTFVLTRSPVGFKAETDGGIDANSVPIRTFGVRFALRRNALRTSRSEVQIRCGSLRFLSGKTSFDGDGFRRTTRRRLFRPAIPRVHSRDRC